MEPGVNEADTAYREGYDTTKARGVFSPCPYSQLTAEYTQWQAGRNQAVAEKQREWMFSQILPEKMGRA